MINKRINKTAIYNPPLYIPTCTIILEQSVQYIFNLMLVNVCGSSALQNYVSPLGGSDWNYV